METRDHENSTLVFLTLETTISPKDELRERIKIEFYKSYDVMTGIRIAATLGGFFSMMILLVLYKNYCKPSKTLSEEQLNAAVTAAAEEEDRALQAALEATSFYTSLEKKRESLENANQVLLSPRFSSVGGGYSHLTPPLKASVFQQRGKSLPGSVLQFGSSQSSHKKNGKSNFLNADEDFDFIGHTPHFSPFKNYLNILPNRRVSSVTCSSIDSSYLDRRLSGIETGLQRISRDKLLEKKDDQWDYFYPIDIQVIQPTPEMSPSASEKNLSEDHTVSGLQVPDINDQMHRLSVTSFDMGLAPLASISSLGNFSQSLSLQSKSFKASFNSAADNQTCTCADDSLGSDSVFMDEIEEFETDSEFEYDGFDDDYSFCETKERPISRTDMRTLKFASFDSYDASIGQDSVTEITEEETLKQSEEKQSTNARSHHKEHSSDLKRHPSLYEGTRVRKKLVKTYSDPRTSRIQKQLPPWTERGRSGYIPKRQLSSPSKKTIVSDSSQDIKPKEQEIKVLEEPDDFSEGDLPKDLTKFLIPSSSNSSSSFSVTGTPLTQKSESLATSTPIQGFKNDLPLRKTHQLSLPNTQEKRSRLQKQKNIMEDVKPSNQIIEKTEAQQLTGTAESYNFPPFSGGLLKPPNTALSGSCQHLANACISEDLNVPAVQINITLLDTHKNSSEQ